MQNKGLIPFIKLLSIVSCLYEVYSFFALASKNEVVQLSKSFMERLVKKNMLYQKKCKEKCCGLSIVESDTELKSELAEIIWTSRARSKSEKKIF